MMTDLDEFKLIAAIKDKDFDAIAEHTLIILENRSEMMSQLASQHVSILERIDKLAETVKEFEKGFPDGDVHGHRIYHERLIRNVAAQENFWNGLKSDLATKGLWAVILVVVGLIVSGVGVKMGITK